MEMVIDPEDEDQFSTWLDLNMMIVTGGRERTEEEFASVLNKAGLRLSAVHPTPTLLKIVEAVKL
jgi:hypothetical protein